MGHVKFFSPSRKRFARLCIKIEKKFNTIHLNGALGGRRVVHGHSDPQLSSVLKAMLLY
jgi:hypothetical protein